MSLIKLRHFREDDFPSVMSLEERAFPLDAYTAEMIRSRLSAYPEGFFVALQGGEIVGYIAAWVVSSKARIDTMAVDQAHRRKGIGALMLAAALNHFKKKGFAEVELEVRPTNTAAIQLYKKFGFKEAGLKPHYYQADGSDALLMKLKLRGYHQC